MTANFWREPEREKRHREPRSQKRPDAANTPICVKFADHRVRKLERADGAVAEDDGSRPLSDFLTPAQALHVSVHGTEENPQVVVPPEHQASGQR